MLEEKENDKSDWLLCSVMFIGNRVYLQIFQLEKMLHNSKKYQKKTIALDRVLGLIEIERVIEIKQEKTSMKLLFQYIIQGFMIQN